MYWSEGRGLVVYFIWRLAIFSDILISRSILDPTIMPLTLVRAVV